MAETRPDQKLGQGADTGPIDRSAPYTSSQSLPIAPADSPAPAAATPSVHLSTDDLLANLGLSFDGAATPSPAAIAALGLKTPPSSSDAATGTAPAPAASRPPPNTGPAKVITQDDGSLLLDDRFVIKGKGTKDQPYEVTWELLLSARESYQPRLGLKHVPDRVKMLDGKWVRIGGYVAFPIMAQGPEEMLMMLNQWDGCCIGVPPTPYDAIEVKLAGPAEGDQRLWSSGGVVGKLRVDPFLIKDWLVSLYLMDDAKVSKQ